MQKLLNTNQVIFDAKYLSAYMKYFIDNIFENVPREKIETLEEWKTKNSIIVNIDIY